MKFHSPLTKNCSNLTRCDQGHCPYCDLAQAFLFFHHQDPQILFCVPTYAALDPGQWALPWSWHLREAHFAFPLGHTQTPF